MLQGGLPVEKHVDITSGRPESGCVDSAFEILLGSFCSDVAIFNDSHQDADRAGQFHTALFSNQTRVAIVGDERPVFGFRDGKSLCFSGIQRFEQLLFDLLCRTGWSDDWNLRSEDG